MVKGVLLAAILTSASLSGCISFQTEPIGLEPEPTVRVRGTVLDEDTGHPVSGAAVALESDRGSRTDTTPANGTFSFEVVAGPCSLMVHAAGYVTGSFALDCSVPKSLTVRLGAERPSDDLGVDLNEIPGYTPPEPLYRVVGTVRDEDAHPVEGAKVSLEQDAVVDEHRTDETGRFVLAVAEGTYLLAVDVPCTDGVRSTLEVTDNLTVDPIVGGMPQGAPGAPTGLAATPGPGPGQAALRWQAPDSPESVERYIIHRDGDPFQVIGNTLAWADSLYGGGGSHEYAVSAVDICGQQGPASDPVEATPLPAGQVPVEVSLRAATDISTSEEAYPVLAPNGTVVGQRTWRTVSGVGNCCETYVSASADGRLLEYGGTYIQVSDDKGRNWREVSTPIPQVGAEGAVVPAPGGDILAFNWSPYTGDQLWAHKYVASLDAWYYQQIPLHQPFYDRPWIGVIEGPFEIDGVVTPYVSFVMSNYVHGDLMLLSLDGLHYAVPSERSTTQLGGSLTLDWEGLPPDPGRDWTQSIRETFIVPIDDGQGLRGRATLYSCEWGALTPDLRWTCPDWATFRGQPVNDDSLRVDSKGNIHWVELGSGDRTLKYQVSQDGGRTWKAVAAHLPDGLVAEDWDFKANGAHGMAVVGVHASQSSEASSEDQDLVFRFRGTDTEPYLEEILRVGLGDHVFGGGLGSAYDRFDYTTIAILPDGSVALSFGDSEHTPPAIAVEL